MLQTSINSLLITFTLATSAGVLIHDTQVDRAAGLALAVPASLVTYAAVDSVMKSADAHIHVERVSGPRNVADVRNTMPRLNPRDDEHAAFQTKRLAFGDIDSTSLWPSI